MATIKIKELPVKKLSEITGENLMIIEDSVDTKQITIEDLQIFFSADNKITALKTSLENALSALEKDFNAKIKELLLDDSELEKKVNDLYNDHEDTKSRLGNLVEKVVDLENLLNATIARVSKNETAISNLQKYTKEIRTDLNKAIKNIATNTSDITSIKEKNKEQDNRLTANEETIESFKEEYDKKMEELDTTVADNKSEAKKYSDQLYDQIMQYIDFYHHLHEYPPNFDDPNWADTYQMNLIYKVGTIYETTIKDFNTSENLPGTWEYVGASNVYDANGDLILVKYTYKRIE